MKVKRRWYVPALVLGAASLAAAGLASATTGSSSKQQLTKVTLQSKWVVQAQFAGYYAALAKGYYKQAGLDVTIKAGGPDIIPEQVVLGGQAEFGIDWQGSLLATRDKGGDLVNIAPVFTRSGTTEVAWKDSGISNFCQFKGKKFGVWLGGNEFEQYAALRKCGIDPASKSQVSIVAQSFTMDEFLKHQVDGASAMTYNELAQVLESKNPDTGKLYQLSDLKVFKYSQLGTGMLQDGVFVRGNWIKDSANQETAKKFLEASFRGWIYCRDHVTDCVSIVLKNGPTLPGGHQKWQMNEVNKLIWPAPKGIGIMDPASAARTVKVARDGKLIKKAPTTWYRSDLAKAAIANLKKKGVDVTGAHYKPIVVKLTAGGK
jgi:NitT/TauT family transport system substrate-binding protein